MTITDIKDIRDYLAAGQMEIGTIDEVLVGPDIHPFLIVDDDSTVSPIKAHITSTIYQVLAQLKGLDSVLEMYLDFNYVNRGPDRRKEDLPVSPQMKLRGEDRRQEV